MDPTRSNSDSHLIRSSDDSTPTHPGRDEFPSTSQSSNFGGAKYKLMSPAQLPISRSGCITIPPGLSPTSFLESPVLLSNMAEPSPTTGSLIKPQMMHGSSGSSTYAITSIGFANTNTSDEKKFSGFEFKPHARENMVSTDLNPPKSEHALQVQGHQGQPQSLGCTPSVKNEMAMFSEDLSLSSPSHKVDAVEFNQGGQTNTGIQATQFDHRGSGISVVSEKSCDDGYNWRKYGQKLVKGSEFPRSYYKCTHPNCEVKKLFERSHDGQITDIIYKGTHDHPKPQPSRRYTSGSMMSTIQEEKSDRPSSLTGEDDKSTSRYGQTSHAIETNVTLEQAPVTAKDDSLEGSGSLVNRSNDEIDDEDPFSKRRKMEINGFDVTPVIKPIREPRVVVQTLSEVDILDDGYRWRKYGQKVVRGNPNPRSYYKCTNVGCPVRKHVERACHDPKAVITTYEGKHNHDVPAAKTSSHDTAGPSIMGGPSRFRSEESEDVSLDLGVGISTTPENRSNDYRQTLHSELLECQTHNSNSSFNAVQADPSSTYFGVLNRGVNQYGSRENLSEGGRSIEIIPLNHSSYQYPQNMGRILTGP